MIIMTSKKKSEFIKSVQEATPIEADFMVGLTDDEVAGRIDEGFTNKTQKKVTKTYYQIFVDNFFSFFNLVFFGIAILMMIAQMPITFYFFLVPIICNIVIGLIADIHARILVDKLRLVTDPKTTLMRSGKEVQLSNDDVVLSDIMVVKAGDQISADAILVNGHLKMDESLLTGESEAIQKGIGDQILSGSYVKSGKAYVRVNRVGIANYAEGLQDSAKKFDRPNSELKTSTLKIFWTTGIIAIVIFIMMIVTWLINDHGEISYQSYQHFIEGASGSLEAMIPAGLYLLTSLTLAIGIINLAKKRMNVQELYSIEMLARVDTICFDKTGTLTDGRMSIRDIYNYSEYTDDELGDLLASLIDATGDDNSTAKALKNAYSKHTHVAVSKIPFDSDLKYSSASFDDIGTITMGAPGFVEAEKNEIGENRINQLTSRGNRVIGVYYSKKMIKNNDIPAKNRLIAVISMQDHIKDDAKPTIDWFKNNGVDVRIISGDNPVTVSEISNEVGVPNAANYVSMEGVKDEEIPDLVKKYTVFGRVKPEQKALIISSLQEEGHKVAMTGDGVNDIIALKTADCSIAMASGSSAARNVAHMVSLDNDFSKLPDVVAEGRRVINNLQRAASLFLSKTVFAIVISLFFLVYSWCAGEGYAYPFNTKNMMPWEMITIGAGGLLLSLQPSKERLKGSFMGNVLSRSLPAGLAEILCVIVLYSIHLIYPDFLDYPTFKCLAVISFTAISYLVLLRISLPFDKYRGVVFASLVIIGFIFFGADIFVSINFPNSSFANLFGIHYSALNLTQWLVVVGLFVVLVALYFGSDALARKLAKNMNLLGDKKS
jgi:cation-transporting ATPase E